MSHPDYPTYHEWMQAVDAHLRSRSGLSSDDLADQTYHDWYDDGMDPIEAAEQVLENEGFPG